METVRSPTLALTLGQQGLINLSLVLGVGGRKTRKRERERTMRIHTVFSYFVMVSSFPCYYTCTIEHLVAILVLLPHVWNTILPPTSRWTLFYFLVPFFLLPPFCEIAQIAPFSAEAFSSFPRLAANKTMEICHKDHLLRAPSMLQFPFVGSP